MACGYAKFTGRVCVCLATSGRGGIHLLTGLYDDKLDRPPVLAITGMAYHDLVHTFTQQDVELDKLFMDVAVHNRRVMGKAHVKNSVDLAIPAALASKGVAHVTIPADVQDMQAGQRSMRNKPNHSSDTPARAAAVPDELLMVGTSFPYIEYLPKPDRAVLSRSTSIRYASDSAIRWRSAW
jgi:pyruvate dehydrogenase (quinone)/pyruvate oxidase